jgi:subtilisin family serine protease
MQRTTPSRTSYRLTLILSPAALALCAALLPACGDELDADLDDDELALREQDKEEEHKPPPPPTPPSPSADEDEDLVKKGKPKKDKDVGKDDIKDHYIVKLKDDGDVEGAIKEVDAKPKHVFGKAIKGFAGQLSPGQRKQLEKRGDVESIEADQLVTTVAVQYMDGAGQPWGLDRVDQRSRLLNKWYIYFRNAWGVRAYVIDTGIQSNHPDFYSALAMYDVFGGNGQDCHGHGTHVAGTIGGNVHGVAKQTFLRGVRVLGCNGNGTISGVIAGVDWVARNHIKPAVANMSLGGGRSDILNAAVNNLANSGVFIAVAAGNDNANACNGSPSSAANAFSVAASDASDNRAWFSNYGGCVHAYAPGVNIKSSWIGSSTRNLQGTSMAAPHVAGTAALYKAIYGDLPWQTLRANLIAWSTFNTIIGNPSGTPNILLYQPF